MINRLGWKATVSDQESLSDSNCSVDSLTDADQIELDNLSFLSLQDDGFSDSDSDTSSVIAPPFSPTSSTSFGNTKSCVTQPSCTFNPPGASTFQ